MQVTTETGVSRDKEFIGGAGWRNSELLKIHRGACLRLTNRPKSFAMFSFFSDVSVSVAHLTVNPPGRDNVPIHGMIYVVSTLALILILKFVQTSTLVSEATRTADTQGHGGRRSGEQNYRSNG